MPEYPDVEKLDSSEKAALLKDLMKHYTGPTEAMLTSLQERLGELQDVVNPPDEQEKTRRIEVLQDALKRSHDQESFNHALQALLTLGYDLTIMLNQASSSISYAMEVATELACRKLGYAMDIERTSPPAVGFPPMPGSPAPPPTAPACPCPEEPPAGGDDRRGDGPG